MVSVTILKDSSESSAEEDELIDAKNRGGLCHHVRKCVSQNKVFQGIKMQNTEKSNERKYMFLVKTFLPRIVYIACTSINR